MEARVEIAGQVVAHADDELASPFLRGAEFFAAFDLGVNAITREAPGLTEGARLVLDGSKVAPAPGGAEAKDVFDDEDLGLKKLHVIEEVAEEVTARVLP